MPTTTYDSPCTLGLESALAEELAELGAQDIETRAGGCSFQGSPETAARVTLWSRIAIRVQEELIRGRTRDKHDLYDLVRSLDWERMASPRHSLAVTAHVRDSWSRDSRFPGLVVKDAVVDAVRDVHRSRPNVDKDDPDLPLRMLLKGDTAILYRDLAGTSMHKRGYRPVQVKSPLGEAIAAGLLRLAGWDRQADLYDPMCGSGTVLIEAALWAADRAPGLERGFAAERWPDCYRPIWKDLRRDAEHRARTGLQRLADGEGPNIAGADRHSGAVRIALSSLQRAGLRDSVSVHTGAVAVTPPPYRPDVVFTNPPWGQRIGEGEDLTESWKDLGDFFRTHCGGATAFVLCGEPVLTRELGMRADRKLPVKIGPVDCRLLVYPIRDRRGEPQDRPPADSPVDLA